MGYTSASVWEAFLNGSYYVTVSFNPDGTISYYRDGVLMLTYAANATPSYPQSGSSVTPASIAKAVIDYYYYGELSFKQSVYKIQVGYSVPYDETLGIKSVVGTAAVNAPAYNISGQRVGDGYRGLVIQNGKKYIRK